MKQVTTHVSCLWMIIGFEFSFLLDWQEIISDRFYLRTTFLTWKHFRVNKDYVSNWCHTVKSTTICLLSHAGANKCLSKTHVGEAVSSVPSRLLRRERNRPAAAITTITVNIYSPGWITLHYNNIPFVPLHREDMRKKKGSSVRWGRWTVKHVLAATDVEESAGGSPMTVPCVWMQFRLMDSDSCGYNFSLESVGVMTVWQLLAHVRESSACCIIILNGCIEGMGGFACYAIKCLSMYKHLTQDFPALMTPPQELPFISSTIPLWWEDLQISPTFMRSSMRDFLLIFLANTRR